MAQIKISGYQELIQINNDVAKKIMKSWLNKDVLSNTRMQVSDTLAIEKGAIKAVWLDEERRGDPKFFQKFEDYRNEWIERVNLIPFDKALKTIDYFKLWYKTLKEKEPNEDEISKAIELCKKWFEENKLRNYPDPRIFSELISEISEEKQNVYGTFISFKPLVRKGIIDIIGNIIQRDIQMSKEYFLNSQVAYKKDKEEEIALRNTDEIDVANIAF